MISYHKKWYHIIGYDIISYFKNVCEPQPLSRMLTLKMTLKNKITIWKYYKHKKEPQENYVQNDLKIIS